MASILITGASGFIGSFIVEEALRCGMDTWAAVRATSSRRYLSDSRIHFVEIDLSSSSQIAKELARLRPDYIVHAAGATKCRHSDDFIKVNADGTENLAKAIIESGINLKRLVFISSLSVMGDVAEQLPHRDIVSADTPQPNTAYGRSKLEAERRLATAYKQLPYVVLRPTGVYGPRERDYFIMAKSIKQHVDFAAGYSPQDITFIYVKDLVAAVFLALERGSNGAKYFLSDGKVYTSADFSRLLRRAMGNPWVVRITAPLWLLRAVSWTGGVLSRIARRPFTLNNDKYNILKQRNWRCDISPAVNELGYAPCYDLEKGVDETVAWYKQNKWL